MNAKIKNPAIILLFIILSLRGIISLAQINDTVYNYRLNNINFLHGYYFLEESRDLVDSIEISLIGMDGNHSEKFFFIEIKYESRDSIKNEIIFNNINNRSKYILKKDSRSISFRILNTDNWCVITPRTNRIILVVEKFEDDYLISSIRKLSELELLEIRNDIQLNIIPKLVLQEVCRIVIEI